MTRTRKIVITRPVDPLADDIARRLASKRLHAQRAERSKTLPVVKVETYEEAEIYQIAERNHWFAAEQGGMA